MNGCPRTLSLEDNPTFPLPSRSALACRDSCLSASSVLRSLNERSPPARVTTVCHLLSFVSSVTSGHGGPACLSTVVSPSKMPKPEVAKPGPGTLQEDSSNMPGLDSPVTAVSGLESKTKQDLPEAPKLAIDCTRGPLPSGFLGALPLYIHTCGCP